MEQAVENEIRNYVQENPESTNTKLFSFLALLRAYVPDSYLLMSECEMILGPPDPIHGGPPFEERMKPFTPLITRSGPNNEYVSVTDPETAKCALELLGEIPNTRFSRSNIMKNLMVSLCLDEPLLYITQHIKDLLTKREIGENGKEQFSRLITDIKDTENLKNAVFVLKTASRKFNQNPSILQVISRLYYKQPQPDYEKAEIWAKKAIETAPDISYMSDTLGQIYKKRLMRARTPMDVKDLAEKAFIAFKDVEKKAEREVGLEGAVTFSKMFNNRGLFGFIQVAKLEIEKSSSPNGVIKKRKREVKDKFAFFEWYLTYSQPDMETFEPHYFWEDVASCYRLYTNKSAADSTSFAGLLDCLNQGLVTSKGRRAGFEEVQREVSDLEKITEDLKSAYENNADSADSAQRYILSNIILSNKESDSSHIAQMIKLKEIICSFLGTEVGRRSPEFYLLVLLLFWPEERFEATHLSLDLETYVTQMEQAYERSEYAKYLRGRYLSPLFFLGKGSGLSKWIHKSKLDAIVEQKVNAELDREQNETDALMRINQMWISGEVWQIPEIQDLLLPVEAEPGQYPTTPQEVFVCAGESKIKATTEDEGEFSAQGTGHHYLGFTIRGPVVFN